MVANWFSRGPDHQVDAQGCFQDWKKTFLKKAFVVKSLDGTIQTAQSGAQMRKSLGAIDLTMLGVGAIIGAGVFVLTGEAAGKFAGPSVILSYLISSIAAILAALSYVEFAVELPVAGGAYNYINLVFGELLAWQTGITLILEYTLGASAVSKGFSGYFASLIALESDSLSVEYRIFEFDILAFVLIVGLSILLAIGSKESSLFNIGVTVVNLISVFVVLFAAFPNTKRSNYSPFFPNGSRGVFEAAGVVFFSYIGFDTLATTSEEVKNPKFDLPMGVVGSLAICSLLYGLMAAAISGLQSYEKIDHRAPFSEAFAAIDMRAIGDIVSIGALTGIVTSVLVNLMGQARVYVILGRERLLPPWIAQINSRFSTPLPATIVTGLFAGLIALLFNIEILSKLVSVGTLFVLGLVSLAVLVRRYHQRDAGASAWPLTIRILMLVIFAVLEGLSFSNEWHTASFVFIALWFLTTVSLCFLPVVFTPSKFSVPLKPFLPSSAVLATVHLIFSLGWEARLLFLVWQLMGLAAYILYGMHHTQFNSPICGVGLEMQNSEDDSSSLVPHNAIPSASTGGEIRMDGRWDSYIRSK